MNRRLPLAAGGLCLLLALGAYALWQPPAERVSLSAELGGVRDIAATFDGDLIFVAAPGQHLQAGETLFQLNILPLAQALEETRKKLQETHTRLPNPYNTLVNAYLRLLAEELGPETGGDLKEAQAQEEKQRLALEEESDKLAALSLRVRRLELKRGRTAQESLELQALLEEERLGEEALREARARHEQAARDRAEFKKRQAQKEAITRALQNAPAAVQDSLELLHPLLGQAHDLEKLMDSARVSAREPGLVLFRLLREGEKAQAGEAVLYFLPGEGREISLTARFAPEAARAAQPGSSCVAETGNRSLPCEIRAPLPYAPQGKDTPLPFQAVIPLPGPGSFAGIDPRQEIRIRLP